MTATSRFAFGNARVRAMKSRLRQSIAMVPARVRRGPGAAPSRTTEETLAYRELMSAFETLMRSFPEASDLFRSLLRLHEIENLKLGWRARRFSIPAERWMPFWRPLGTHAGLDPESFRAGIPVEELLTGLLDGAPVPPESDGDAAELAWDRWGSEELLRAAKSLSARDVSARRLVVAAVRERDLQVVRRGVSAFGLTPGTVAASTALVREELGERDIALLIDWTAGDGPLDRRIARRLGLHDASPADWPALELALRRNRRDLCRRAFRGTPYCLGPAVAYLTLKEEELRSVRALAESRGTADDAEILRHVLAAGPLER